MIKVNDPKLKSWIQVNESSDFPIQNIPFGVIRFKDKTTSAVTRIGDTIINLKAMAERGYFKDIDQNLPLILSKSTLNDFIALGKSKTNAVREKISELFRIETPEFSDSLKKEILFNGADAEMIMPVSVGDYTDFYSSIEHATNVGKMFRDPENALLPNWLHIPVGYHGRSSSIVISGTDIKRPYGQIVPKGETAPIFVPSRTMDFELETAFVIGKETKLGETISTDRADEYIFGMVLFNDLSARDIQKWEYVPLGPFLAKNFGSVISPWIVTLEALQPFAVEGPEQKTEVLDYLKFSGKKNYDIHLDVYLQPENGEENLISKSNYKYMYWNMNQQLAHHTSNGCNVRVGDMCASGTISGPTPDSFGSMLELSWSGTKTLDLKNDVKRKFIEDNDTIIIRGYCKNNGIRIGFGESKTKILPVG